MSNAVTSSVALTELKTDLTRLSATLHEIFDLMNADMSQVGQAWQDGKYEEFVQSYRPQINKCEEISARYSEWCARVLQPTIENVIAVEKTDVGNGGSFVGGTGTASAGTLASANVAGTVAMGAMEKMAGGFNMSGQNNASPNETAAIDAFLNRTKPSISVKKNLSEADVKCQEKFGVDYHGVPSTKENAHISFGGNTQNNNNKVSSEVEVNLGIIKGRVASEAGDGSSSPEAWAQCVKD